MTYLIFLISGLVAALPFLFSPLWAVEWVALIPLFALAPRVKKRYLHGFLFSMGFYLPLYYWFIKLYPMDFVGFTPVQGGITVCLCWFGLSALQASEMAFIPMIYARICSKKQGFSSIARNAVLAASCFTSFEYLQSLGWHGVPWGRLALTQIGVLPMVQSASLLGSMFICFLIVLTNGLFAGFLPLAIAKWKTADRPKCRVLAASIALCALVIPLSNGIFGAVRMAVYEKEISTAETLRVALIQGNIASGDKWQENSLEKSITKYISMTESALEEDKIDLVLWPETVVTTNLRASRYYKTLSDLAKRHEIILVVGAYALEHTEKGENPPENDAFVRYNALYAFYPDGSCDETTYKKRHLVPFGEYLPVPWFFDNIPFLRDMNLSASALTPGQDAALFDSPLGKLGGLVCFDSIYDTLARSSTNAGADLLLLSTNDSWYRDSHAIYQHNAHAQLRAIESGRAIARAANTGTSSLILPTGQCAANTAPMVDAVLTGELPLMQTKTLYGVVGNLIACLSLTIVFGSICAKIVTFLIKSHVFDPKKRKNENLSV